MSFNEEAWRKTHGINPHACVFQYHTTYTHNHVERERRKERKEKKKRRERRRKRKGSRRKKSLENQITKSREAIESFNKLREVRI